MDENVLKEKATMIKKVLNADFLAALEKELAPDSLLRNQESLLAHASDQTENLVYLPQLVVVPTSVKELSKTLALANEYGVALSARGAGTGLAGGALPQHGQVVISMARLNRILYIDTENMQVRVEAGAITQVLQEELAKQGLYYPPDPASRGSCFIGGNISTNAGGPRAVKYGVVKDYVLSLQVVLANGQIVETGAATLKNSTGYNLTQLFVGSEGTLGIIAAAQLRLVPLPSLQYLMQANFASAAAACAAVAAIFRAGITPSALEFMEREALVRAMRYLGEAEELPANIEAQLLIEVDGNHAQALLSDCEQIAEVLETHGSGSIAFADSQAQKDMLWKRRRCIGHAVKQGGYYKEEDTVVPRARLPQLLAKVKELGQEYGFESICYGHAGDGNLHVNILRGTLDEQSWQDEIPRAIRKLFEEVRALGGTISGEHGIGLVQVPYLDIVFSEEQRRLFREIKAVFDPKGILNPGKAI